MNKYIEMLFSDAQTSNDYAKSYYVHRQIREEDNRHLFFRTCHKSGRIVSREIHLQETRLLAVVCTDGEIEYSQ